MAGVHREAGVALTPPVVAGGLTGHVQSGVQHLVDHRVGDARTALSEQAGRDGDAWAVRPVDAGEPDAVTVGRDAQTMGSSSGSSGSSGRQRW